MDNIFRCLVNGSLSVGKSMDSIAIFWDEFLSIKKFANHPILYADLNPILSAFLRA
jgi:hypothetical protein